MKTMLITMAAGSLLAGLATAQPAPRYTISDLGAVGGVGQPYFVANNMVVSGASVTPAGSLHAVLWYFGIKIDLTAHGLGGPNSLAYGVNMAGQVVGAAQTSTPNTEDFCGFNALGLPASNSACVPFVWNFGVMTQLPTLGGANGFANSINSSGQAVGYAETTLKNPNPGCPVSQFLPVLWQNGAATALPTYGGDPVGVAAQINERGQIVGASGTCAPFDPNNGYLVEKHALLWEDGQVTDLGNLGGIVGPAGNHACTINNRGQVAGHSQLADNGTFHGFLWTKETGMQDLGTLPGDAASVAIGIGDSGAVVGASLDADFNPRAALWENGKVTDLNTVVPTNTSLYLLLAFSVNAEREIVGLGVTAKGEVHAYMATPR